MTLDHGRILTTHTGSLPRPDDLIQIMWAREDGIPVDAPALQERIIAATEEVVGRQAAAGIDIINDGEMSKPGYATSVKDRLRGFDGDSIKNYFFAGLADDEVLCPAVIEPQSNYLEHPEVVAQRIERYACILRPDRMMAGVYCGFGVHVGMQGIDPDVAFAKPASLAEAAAIASNRLF